MTTLTKRTNGLGLKKDLKSLTPSTFKTVDKKAETQAKEDVKSTSSVNTAIEDQTKVEKPIVEVQKPAPIPVPELTLEQKIEKVENLKTLIEKREILEQSRKKLNSFVVGANQFNEAIKLTDENGNSFQTSNTEVFAKVVDTINSTLIEKIKEIELQINF